MIHTRAVNITLGCVSNRGGAHSQKGTLHPLTPFLWLDILYKLFYAIVNSLFTKFIVFYNPNKFFWLFCAIGQLKVATFQRNCEQIMNKSKMCRFQRFIEHFIQYLFIIFLHFRFIYNILKRINIFYNIL